MKKRLKHMAVALALVGTVITGGAAIQPPEASAAWAWDGWKPRWYPDYCDYSTQYLNRIGFVSREQCIAWSWGYSGPYLP